VVKRKINFHNERILNHTFMFFGLIWLLWQMIAYNHNQLSPSVSGELPQGLVNVYSKLVVLKKNFQVCFCFSPDLWTQYWFRIPQLGWTLISRAKTFYPESSNEWLILMPLLVSWSEVIFCFHPVAGRFGNKNIPNSLCRRSYWFSIIPQMLPSANNVLEF